jgi:hypothetical protein
MRAAVRSPIAVYTQRRRDSGSLHRQPLPVTEGHGDVSLLRAPKEQAKPPRARRGDVGVNGDELAKSKDSPGKKPRKTRPEQELIVSLEKSWEDARIEGSTKTQANAVLTVLQVRGIAVPAAARKRILGQKDLKQLDHWLKKAVVAGSIEEVIGNRS